jgi:Na+/melibiose symporter-like transporter
VIASNVTQSLNAGAGSAAALYFVTLTLGFGFSAFSQYIVWTMVAAILSPPAWVWLAARLGRSHAFAVAAVVHVASYLAYLTLAPGDHWPLMFIGAVGGIANSGISLLSVSLLTDVIEIDTAKSGGRGALLSSFYTLSEKVAVALGAFAVAGILSLGGFVESRGTPVVQTPEALAAGVERVRAFAPDMLVVALGVDTYAGDPAGGFRLEGSDYTRLGAALGRLKLPTLFTMEGGYRLDTLGPAVGDVLTAFEGA